MACTVVSIECVLLVASSLSIVILTSQ